jgi:phosphoglucosamine mutase
MLRFGTDGVRGQANTELTAEFALLLGRASHAFLQRGDWLIGWDTRMSSEMLASAFCAGVASAGGNITALGEVPTAAVAMSCRSHNMVGAMITASHNAFQDNGIKIFGSDGVKLPEDSEHKIEALMQVGGDSTASEAVGRIQWQTPAELRDEHDNWLIRRAAAIDASGLRIALDCANGAAYKVAPLAIKSTRATVTPLACDPDGSNINFECGSTHLGALKDEVTQHNLDFGLALDGDADRLLAVDASGQKIDGDEIVAILAHHRMRHDALAGRGVVVTSWSNQGLVRSLQDAGIAVEVCKVGDKFVAEAMKRTGFGLGGEQSGHIIMSDLLPVGDGISTAIELIAAVVESGRPLAEVAARSMRKFPQLETNIAVASSPAMVVRELEEERQAISSSLGEGGRLVLRPSGTESVVRVMAEAEDAESLPPAIRRIEKRLQAYAKRVTHRPANHTAGKR